MQERTANAGEDRKERPAPPRTPGEDVSDPHPGSVSDGTHPEASEVKRPDGDPGQARRRPS